MEITKEIFQVGGSELSASGDAAVYLIKIGRHSALVDAGTGHGTERILDNIRSCAVDPRGIEYLLITHCHFDHTGGAKEIKDLTQCTVVAHELEAPYLEQADQVVTAAKWYGARLKPFTVDRKIRGDKEEIVLGDRIIEAIHIPGHSPGSMAFVMESEGLKVLFGQDVHGPLDASLLSDRKKYNQSLKLMLSLEADILCEGHYGVVRGKEQVRDFISSFVL
ncbi:MAG: MBL fold metallo-hydrolase [Deltaproteobacteria bacterium]|nr:MAG: MBL fold metallo-hydrolase [Deltaproteobacteria bacterium]